MLDDYSFYANILDCHILHINVADDHTSYNSGINYCILYMTRSLCHIFYINIIDDQILFFKHALCPNIVRSEILRSSNLCELNRCDHTLDIVTLQGYTLRRSPFTTAPLTSPATTRLSQSPSFTSKSSATIFHANIFCHYALCHHKWRTASFLVGVVAFVGTMSCVESVSAAGDDYPMAETMIVGANVGINTRRSLMACYSQRRRYNARRFEDMKQSEEIMKQCVIEAKALSKLYTLSESTFAIEAKALSKLYTLPENTFVDIRACSVLWTDNAVIEVKALSKLHTLPGNTLVDIPACSVLWADSAVRLRAATGIFLLSSAVVHCFAIFVARLCAAAEIFLLFSPVAHSFDIFIVQIYATVYILSLVHRCFCSLLLSSPASLQAIATSSPLVRRAHLLHQHHRLPRPLHQMFAEHLFYNNVENYFTCTSTVLASTTSTTTSCKTICPPHLFDNNIVVYHILYINNVDNHVFYIHITDYHILYIIVCAYDIFYISFIGNHILCTVMFDDHI
ncbi:unnamed protein product [Symbiodinium sp. KB8]|nr:unnamed protein product [Symbiodinium sp. KB8]